VPTLGGETPGRCGLGRADIFFGRQQQDVFLELIQIMSSGVAE
jgi:hypothetical protein